MFALAKKHIRACFPSFWSTIGAGDRRIRQRFGTFNRELNLYRFTGPQIGKTVYVDKLISDSIINMINYRDPKAVWPKDNSQTPVSEVVDEISVGT